MTGITLDMRWAHSQDFHFEDGKIVINDNAPQEIKDSYQNYLKQLEEFEKREHHYLIIPKCKFEGFEEIQPDYIGCSDKHEDELAFYFDIPYCEYRMISDKGYFS